MRWLPLLSLVALGCGAAGSTPSTPAAAPSPPPPIEVGVTSAATLRTVAATLHDLGGAQLTQALTPMLTAQAALPIADDRPVRLVLDVDGAWIQAARARDVAAVEAAVRTAWPTAIASVSNGGKLWTSADAVLAVHGDAVYLVRGDAASSRARAALRLADEGGLVDAAPVEGAPQLWAAADGAPLLALLGVRTLTAESLGTQLGRSELSVAVAADRVSWTLDAHPVPGSVMAELLAHPPTTGQMTPHGVVGVAGMLPPEVAMRLATTLAVEANLLEPGELARELEHPLTGFVALSTSGASFGADGMGEAYKGMRLGTVGPQALWGTGGGLATGYDGITTYTDSVQWCPTGIFPALPDGLPATDERLLPDDNDDVPWSYEFKLERAKIEAAIDAARATDDQLLNERRIIGDRRVNRIEDLRASFRATATGLRASQTYLPPGGLDGLRAEDAKDRAAFAVVLERQRVAHATLEDARAAATKQRAADVAAWDRNGGHAP